MARRGKANRLVIDPSAAPQLNFEPTLATAILRANGWFETLKTRQVASIAELAGKQNVPRAWISQQLPLAFLAPDIVETIAAGCQPAAWTIERLVSAAASYRLD